MAQRGPPFDFDLNEPPPEDDYWANNASPPRAPETVREPTPRDLLPPTPQDSLPAPPQYDSLPPPPTPPAAPVPAVHDPLPASASAPEPSAHDQKDQLPASAPEPSAHDQKDQLPASAPVPTAYGLAPKPVPESSPHDPPPATTPEPSARDPLHLPSPVLDLDAPLSSLDDEENGYDYDEADLPPPPPLPPFGLPVVAVAPARSSSSVDAPPASRDRHGGRTSRRARVWQDPTGGEDAARRSSPEPSHMSRRRPYSYDTRDDDAISKQRRVDYYCDEDAASSRSGSRRSGSPRRYERSEIASPPRYEPDGGRHAPPGGPPRNRRRRRRQQHGYNQYPGPDQKQPGSDRELGFRGQERPRVHQDYHGPRGPDVAKVGYSPYCPSSGSFVRLGSGDDGRPSPEEEEPMNGHGGYHHRRDARPFRPSSRPRGREDSYNGRQSHEQGRSKNSGGYQHRDTPPPSLRPSSGAHGRDGSPGGRQSPAHRRPIDGGGAYQHRKAPRGREHFPDGPYHPYARERDGGAFERTSGGNQAGRREPRPDYEHRRDSKQRTSGGPVRGRQCY